MRSIYQDHPEKSVSDPVLVRVFFRGQCIKITVKSFVDTDARS